MQLYPSRKTLALTAGALAMAAASFSTPAAAVTIFQSAGLPVILGSPLSNIGAYCATCGGSQATGEQFTLGSGSTLTSLTFAAVNYTSGSLTYSTTPPLTVSIYQDGPGNTVGGVVWSQSFNTISDALQSNGVDLATIALPNWNLGPGTYDLFVTGANMAVAGTTLATPLPGSGAIYDGAASPLPGVGDLYFTNYGDLGINLNGVVGTVSAPAPVPGAGFAGLAALALSGLYARMRRA